MPSIRKYRTLFLLLLFCAAAPAQERLQTASIQAKAARHPLPALGLPRRADGQRDPVVQFRDGRWRGADSLRGPACWTMEKAGADSVGLAGLPEPVRSFCRKWAEEKPRTAVDVVHGPYRGGWFIALCKRTHGGYGWKTLGFLVPPGGPDAQRSLYAYSTSVNVVEHRIGYNLFPELPAYLQEIVEEMTTAELLVPFQETNSPEDGRPDPETDYDWMEDVRERD